MARNFYLGDSRGVGTEPYLRGMNRKKSVGGKPSSWGADVLESTGKKHANVVFDLGTNDASVKDLKRSVGRVRKATDGNVTMLTVAGPDAAKKNAYLKKLAAKGKIRLVNPGRPDGGDGIHYSGTGYKRRAKVLNRALKGSPDPAPSPAASPAPSTPTSNVALRSYLSGRASSTPTVKKKKNIVRELRKL